MWCARMCILRLRMWAYPQLTLLAIVAMLGIVTAMAFIPEQRLPLLFGIVSLAVLLLAYLLRRRLPSAAPALRQSL